jgi:hypothetical protein
MKTQAVFGDHQRHFARFFMRFIRGGDQFHAMLL